MTATAPFSWDSPETQRLVEGRVLERSRPFSIELSGSGEPGYRSEVITLRHKSKTLVDYPFEWELPRLLSAEPSSLILSTESGKSERTIVLRSHDHAKFRVLKVQADIEGVSSDCQDQVASSTKVIRFAIDPGRLAPGMAGEIKIHTDHPRKPTPGSRSCALPVRWRGGRIHPDLARPAGREIREPQHRSRVHPD